LRSWTEGKRIAEKLLRINYRYSNVLDDYLDHWLHILRIEPLDNPDKELLEIVLESYKIYIDARSTPNRDGFPQMTGWADVIGNVFEQYKSKGAKQSFGQFFTPEHVCDLMSALIGTTGQELSDGRMMFYDPTSGSARTLMSAHWNSIKDQDFATYPHRKYFYCANDLDQKCSKMSLINMFLHGMSGEITNANGLWMQNDYRWGYRIEHIPIKEKLTSKQGLIEYHAYRLESLCNGEEPVSMQDIFNYHYNSDIWYCTADGTTVISMPGDNHLRLVKKISKEESLQVQGEIAMSKQGEQERKEEEENKTGAGLFYNVKKKDVIQVKKTSTATKQEVQKPVPKSKPKLTPKDIGTQMTLF